MDVKATPMATEGRQGPEVLREALELVRLPFVFGLDSRTATRELGEIAVVDELWGPVFPEVVLIGHELGFWQNGWWQRNAARGDVSNVAVFSRIRDSGELSHGFSDRSVALTW